MHIKYFPLIHLNDRPSETIIDTVVIHSMYAKGVARPTAAISCFQVLDQCKVSAHYSIDRLGTTWQHVDPLKRAWHAGESLMPSSKKHPKQRLDVNNFSIGIEMIGVWGQRFKARQYCSLNKLLTELCKQFPIETIVSHQTIAPTRKQDPGPSFCWDIVRRELRKRKISVKIIS